MTRNAINERMCDTDLTAETRFLYYGTIQIITTEQTVSLLLIRTIRSFIFQVVTPSNTIPNVYH
jgi:hypothetical protein